ncbi:MAG: hypothetical protein KF721_09820, partial [Ignavibacteriaceae bacterium]|nr:hypothetical protein [Ignavibacteriaceae bacterium]
FNDVDQAAVIDFFLQYQLEWIKDPSQISIRNKSRRTGGTETVAFESILWGFETTMPSKDIWFTSADKKAAEEFIVAATRWAKIFNLAAQLVDTELINEDDEHKFFLKYELKIPLGDTGDVLRVHAMSSAINSFHGKQGFMIVDEMARHKDQSGLWEGAFPATLWGYPLRIISTQNGKGFFYRLCRECEEGKRDNWGYHKVDIFKAVEQGLYDKIAIGKGLIQPGEVTSPQQRNEWIEDIKRNCLTDSVWHQQFLCEAEDEGDKFLSYELISSCTSDDILWQQDVIQKKWNGSGIKKAPDHYENKWIHQTIITFSILINSFEVSGQLYLGWDTGRKKDLSVAWLYEKIGTLRITRLVIALEKMPFWVQELFRDALLQHPKLRRACFDATGIGAQLAENARLKFGDNTVEEVTFTNKVKESMAYKLKGLMEDKDFRIPADRIIEDDFHKPKKETTAAGNVRFVVEEDESANEHSHADYFWAACLCNEADSYASGPVKTASGRKREAKKILRGYYA